MESSTITLQPSPFHTGTLKLRGAQYAPETTAYPELDRDGFVVVKGVLTPAQARGYVDRSYQWLESFGLGFDRDDESTWHLANLPAHQRGGLFNRHGINHEQYVWDIRAEPALIDAFAKIWGTDQLLVSFDGANISIPVPDEELGQMKKPWPHVDQSPLRRDKNCVQGIMNLAENGPHDGGLMILEGSFALYSQFFDEHADQAPPGGWPLDDFYPHTEKQMQWFYNRGCRWKKICAGPGDLILWDSRCIHYGSPPEGRNPRIATYVCYKPVALITPEMLERKQEVARQLGASSHDPVNFRATGALEKGKMSEDERLAPVVLPILSERALQLAGLSPYH